jgi:rare lipoprotein A
MGRFQKSTTLFCALQLLFGCAALGPSSKPGDSNEGFAAYYSDKFHGHPTASGALYDKTALTAAHRTLPFGTVVRVTNLTNRRTVEVTVTDRGPFSHNNRIIDLSRKAAERIDMIQDGVVPVRIEIVKFPSKER